MSKEEVKDIVGTLIEELKKMEYGTCISTYRLLKYSGFDVDGFNDLADIHMELFRQAEENHIILDMSAHENKCEGLPYNLTFIVRNQITDHT